MFCLRNFSVAVLAACMMGGCTHAPGPAVETAHIGVDMIYTRTASAASTFVHAPGSDYFICNHPAPDAAFDQAEGGDLTVSLVATGSSEGADAEESANEIELSGRTPVLLMSRELLFRNCEFSHNYKLTKDEAVALHKTTLDMIGKVWEIEAGNTTITNADALTISGGANINGEDSVGGRRTSSDDDEDDEGSDDDLTSDTSDSY